MNSLRLACLVTLASTSMLVGCGGEGTQEVSNSEPAVAASSSTDAAPPPARDPVTRACFSARISGYATIHANDVTWMYAGDPAVAERENPFGCSRVRVQYGNVTADYCRGIARFDNEVVRPLLMPGQTPSSPWVGPIHEGGILSLRARMSFAPGPMPVNMFARASDAHCVDHEWLALEKVLPKDTSTWTRCEAAIALAIEVVRAYQADPGEQPAAAWAKANKKALLEKYPTSSDRLLGLVMGKMYRDAVPPGFFLNDYRSCLATL